MTEEWFKWVIGGLFSLGSAALSWTILTMLSVTKDLQKQISKHESRLAVLEDRTRIDPTKHAEEMAELRHTIKNLEVRMRGQAR